jgi:hypothetical protein
VKRWRQNIIHREERASVVKKAKILTGLKLQRDKQMTRNKVRREEMRRESVSQRKGKQER